jgi:hypothetical protein
MLREESLLSRRTVVPSASPERISCSPHLPASRNVTCNEEDTANIQVNNKENIITVLYITIIHSVCRPAVGMRRRAPEIGRLT